MRSFSYISRSNFPRVALFALLTAALTGCLARGTNEARRYTVPRDVAPIQADSSGHLVVDFATLKSNILEPRCLECHADMDTAEGLAQYVKAGDPGGSSLYISMADGSMPPGGPAADDHALEIVREYVLQIR